MRNLYIMPKSWLHRETSMTALESIRRAVVDKLWQERVIDAELPASEIIAGFSGLKAFLGHSRPNTYDGDEKSTITFVNEHFARAIEEKAYESFAGLFSALTLNELRIINNGERLGLPILDRAKVPVVRPASIPLLQEYLRDKGYSAAVSIVSDGDSYTLASEDVDSKKTFAIHSVGKVLTGVLMLRMLQEGVVSEEDLDKPVQLDPSVLESLSDEVREKLKTVTLKQLMLHQSGLRDYLMHYFAAIEEALDKEEPVPAIASCHDLLGFADTEVDEEPRYSNLGILLVGLAIEHAYRSKREPKSYEEILREFIVEPVGMTHFSAVRPSDAQFNLSDRLAPHIAGSPAGGYWTTVEDLQKFGVWVNRRCQTDAEFLHLMEAHGGEFYSPERRELAHDGGIPSASAFLVSDLDSGTTIAVLSLQGAMASQLSNAIAEHCTKDNALSALMQKTREILRERFGSEDIEIASITYLSEPDRRNVLMRITLSSASDSVPKSIILKQSLPQEKDADDSEAYARFARDWAGLEFANSIQADGAHHVPRFYGGDKALRFILVEDLGAPHISLIDTLLYPNREAALSALERYMKALGSFHATSFGRTDDYTRCLGQINETAAKPSADKEAMSTLLLPVLASSCEALELSFTAGVADEIRQVLDAVFEPGPFTVLAHGDIAPDNVFDHEEGLQLMDFEWSFPRSALLDGTYLRMSMPTAWCAKAVPEEVLAHCEQIYREELIKVISAAADDRVFATAYTEACAYHALHQLAQVVQMLEKDALWGSASLPEGAIWKDEANSARPRLLSRLQAFVDVATKHDLLPNLRTMAEAMLTRVKALWPVETKPLDYYPAFSAPTLRLSTAARTVGLFRVPSLPSLQRQLEAEHLLNDTTPADPYGPGAIVPYKKP